MNTHRIKIISNNKFLIIWYSIVYITYAVLSILVCPSVHGVLSTRVVEIVVTVAFASSRSRLSPVILVKTLLPKPIVVVLLLVILFVVLVVILLIILLLVDALLVFDSWATTGFIFFLTYLINHKYYIVLLIV